ncbi:ribonuclease H-like domain-containing protein, partial [Tanacetum coccineum]
MEKLKISYDGLKKVEKKLFLDIACFFRQSWRSGYSWRSRNDVMEIFDACGEHPDNPEKHNRVWKKEEISNMCIGDATTENDKIEAMGYNKSPAYRLVNETVMTHSITMFILLHRRLRSFTSSLRVTKQTPSVVPSHVFQFVSNLKKLRWIHVTTHNDNNIEGTNFLSNELRVAFKRNFEGITSSNFIDLINNLDVGNPLHVQNSDNSNYVIISFKILGTENYRIWSGVVKLALQVRNKYGFVDDTCLKESYATSDVLSAQWDICNAMVLTWIMNVVSQDVYMGLVYSKNDAAVWKELNETYDKVVESVVYNLLQKINSIKQGGSLVADYYHRLNSLWREFDALTKFPKCTCDVKCSCDASKELGLHKQLMKLMQFLIGLDDCYEHVRSSLLTIDPLLKVKDAYNVVSREESHRGVLETSGGIESKQNATSFVAKTFNNNRRQFNNNNNFTRGSASNVNRGPNPNLNCKHCGKIGHTIDRCFENFGFPQGFKRNPNIGKQTFNANSDVKISDKYASSSPSSGFTPDQMQNSSISLTSITMGWIIDSGANQHLTVSTVRMYNVVNIFDLKITVGHSNGTLATISHVGNLKLTENVILYDVLVVPSYYVSLMS